MKDMTILFVDDEREILSVLKRDLRKEAFKLHFALGADNALQILMTEPIHLIVTDMIMPDIDGLSLLHQVKTQYPEIIRIILCEYPYVTRIISEINKGAIFRYVIKPLDPTELMFALNEAVDYYLLKNGKQNLIEKLKIKNDTLKITMAELRQTQDKLQQQSFFDRLTNIPNRRNFDFIFQKEWRRAKRNQTAFSLLMIDIDFFKHFNDTYGRPAGDACLKKIAEALQKVIKRPGDFVARYSGKELAVILPETNAAGAKKIIEDMIKKVKLFNIPHRTSEAAPYVTFSAGVATIQRNKKSDVPAKSFIELIYKLLYKAKGNGRNSYFQLSITDEQQSQV